MSVMSTSTRHVNDHAGIEIGQLARRHRLTADEADPHEHLGHRDVPLALNLSDGTRRPQWT